MKTDEDRAKSIFLHALEIAPESERRAFLQEACQLDEGLREEVEDLLRHNDQLGSFLQTPALEAARTEFLDPLATRATDAEHLSETTEFDSKGANDLSLDFLSPSDNPKHLGQLGQYEITEVIGRGGMGVVLKGHDEKLNRVVGIKVLAPELAGNGTARKRFMREAQAAAAVVHPHVVTIHAVDEGQPPFLVMEFIEGESLQQKIDRDGPLELKEILRIGSQVAAGLAAAHAQGLIHRDIKPANILLENGVERVRITDFGLARAVDDLGVTKTGEVAGTPQYMSPEQAEGNPVDHRSDLFSLGSVLYALCTGRSPFRAESTLATIRRVCDAKPRPIRELNPDIPPWLVEIINRLLEKQPAHRIQTASEVADLLERHLAHLQDPHSTPPPAGLGRHPARPWRWPVVAMMLLAGLLIWEFRGSFRFASDQTLPDPDERNSKASKAIPSEAGLLPEAQAVDQRQTATRSEDGAFVVLGSQNSARKFNSLSDAVAGSDPGDTIEIHGNGPYVTDPMIIDRALAIRAAIGFRPVITLDREQNKTALFLLRNLAPLLLEGLELRRTGPNDTGQFQTIIQSREKLSLVNCRLLATTRRDCLWSARTLDVRNSELLVSDPDNMNPVSWDPGLGGWVVINNCVIMGAVYCKHKGGPLGAETRSIQLRNNTLVAVDGLRFDVVESPVASPVEESGAAIEMETSSNVFHLRRSLLLFNQPALTEPFEEPAAEALLRRFLAWRDHRDVYGSGSNFCTFAMGVVPVGTRKDLQEWNRFWGLPETATIQGSVRFQGGDLFARARSDVAQLTPEDFRLHSDSAGIRAGAEGKDLGADVDLVGPGAAYDRWKQKPEYQVWLKESRQWMEEAKAEATAVNQRGEFAVLGPRGLKHRFSTLAEAVAGSGEGDEIVIQGDGPFLTLPIGIEHKLTIRAAEGHRPVIRLAPPADETAFLLLQARAALVLEGIQFERTTPIRPGGKVAIIQSLAKVGMANCRLVQTGNVTSIWSKGSVSLRNCELHSLDQQNATAISWEPTALGRLEIANCILTGWIYLPSDAIKLESSQASLSLSNNTVVAARGIQLSVLGLSKLLPLEPGPARMRVETIGNLFQCLRYVTFDQASAPEPLDANGAERMLRELVDWHDERNVYASGSEVLILSANLRPLAPPKEHQQWNDFWGFSETGTRMDAIRFQGGDLSARAKEAARPLTPRDFRLRPDSAGYQARTDGKDLGANVDLVGPGTAYETWKTTPGYQSWRDATKQRTNSVTDK